MYTQHAKRLFTFALALIHLLLAGETARGAVLCVEADGHASVERACETAWCENLTRWHTPAMTETNDDAATMGVNCPSSCVDLPVAFTAAAARNQFENRIRYVAPETFNEVPALVASRFNQVPAIVFYYPQIVAHALSANNLTTPLLI